MFKLKSQWLALLSGALIAVSPVLAQDSGPLIDLLIKKGIINDQDGEQLRADLTREASAAVVSTISGGKSTVGLSISGRMQVQYAGLGTQIDGTATNPVSTEHFFMRRMYFGAKANLGNGWSSTLNYDFAGLTFDQAFITWRKDDTLSVDVGFRKVPFGLEEWYTSSGSLKAIERSPGTRYFVESNNGRRLGAGSYRIGAFVGGKFDSGLFYNVAVTNPERDESSNGTAAGVAFSGNNTNNNLSEWGNLGYVAKVGSGEDAGTLTVSGSVGNLPDQGGKVLGAGDNLTVYNAFADFLKGPFDLQLEYFGSSDTHGVSASQSSKSSAYSIQPAYTVGNLEYVVRYTFVNSDHRGVNLSDGIRSAPGGGTMNKMSEWFIGGTYFFRGNDCKLQLGYISGESKDTVTGGAAKAKTEGVRSQMQVNF
jgi:hypothetical protein